MKCPKCNGNMRVEPMGADGKTVRRTCENCGMTQVVEAKDGAESPRRMLTDDMPGQDRRQYLVEG